MNAHLNSTPELTEDQLALYWPKRAAQEIRHHEAMWKLGSRGRVPASITEVQEASRRKGPSERTLKARARRDRVRPFLSTGMTYREIATELGECPNAVAKDLTLLRRAIKDGRLG